VLLFLANSVGVSNLACLLFFLAKVQTGQSSNPNTLRNPYPPTLL